MLGPCPPRENSAKVSLPAGYRGRAKGAAVFFGASQPRFLGQTLGKTPVVEAEACGQPVETADAELTRLQKDDAWRALGICLGRLEEAQALRVLVVVLGWVVGLGEVRASDAEVAELREDQLGRAGLQSGRDVLRTWLADYGPRRVGVARLLEHGAAIVGMKSVGDLV
jgi:hypothetical protein